MVVVAMCGTAFGVAGQFGGWLPEEGRKGFTAPNCRSDLPARMRNVDLHGDIAFEAVARAVASGRVSQQSNEW